MPGDTPTPAVSVVMAVYNGERYLGAALDSILTQTFIDFELIVVDDGSKDGSAAVVDRVTDPRLHVLTNPTNMGLTRSLNRGLAAARGRYIARQDADDVSYPDRLQRQVAYLETHPDVALLGTAVRTIDERGRRRQSRDVRPSSQGGVQWRLLFGNPFAHSSVMFRRAVVWESLGGYDESFQFNQDFALWSRLLERHAATNLPEPLVGYRAHQSSIMGRRDDGVRESRLTNLARNIAIQRGNIRRILGREDLAEEWPPLWTSLNVEWLTGKPTAPDRAVPLIAALHEAFCQRYPGSREDVDVRAGLATVLAHVAAVLAQTHRRAACQAYAAAVRADPGIASSWAPQVAGHLLFGHRGSRAVRRVRTLLRKV